jgi:hypothetical protein
MVQHLSDPLALKLRGGWSIGEIIRALRTIDKKEVGITGGRHSQMGSNAIHPLLLQSPAVYNDRTTTVLVLEGGKNGVFR